MTFVQFNALEAKSLCFPSRSLSGNCLLEHSTHHHDETQNKLFRVSCISRFGRSVRSACLDFILLRFLTPASPIHTATIQFLGPWTTRSRKEAQFPIRFLGLYCTRG